MLNLKTKDKSVNLEGLHTAFEKVAPIIRTAYAMYGAEAVITSAVDGVHSKQTAHDKGLAIDLRTRNLPDTVDRYEFAVRMGFAIEHQLGEEWYIVLEHTPPHIHLEYAPLGTRPNIKGWVKGKNLYVQK
jgi:hypothetical protein